MLLKIKRNILLQITMLLLVVLLTVPVSAEILETLPQDVGEITGMPEETVDMEAEQIVETYPVYREVEAIPALDSLPMPGNGDRFESVPRYFQTDYPDNMYGSGTIANNGCGVACLAMVATYMTDHEYLPDELARYFGGVAENNIERLEKGAEAMQLAWEKMENFHKAMAALKEGKVVVALMESTSIFTDSQHFIVLTGFNEDGLIMVNDPYEPNYDKWNLKRAFREGFTEGDICRGFGGAWAFDKSAMPEEPFLYHEKELRVSPDTRI